MKKRNNKRFFKALMKARALKDNKIVFFARNGIYYEVNNKLIFIKD